MRNSAFTPTFAHCAATTRFTSASSTAGSMATRAFTISSASRGFSPLGSDNFGAVSLLITLPTANAPASSMPISFRCATSPPRVRHTVARSRENVRQEYIEIERLRARQRARGVQPAEFGLALGISVVVDVENLAPERALLLEQFREGVEPGPGGRA